MTDKIVSVEMIKEISEQLQMLYGHAVTDIMPIVLHAIRMNALFETIAAIVTVIVMSFFFMKFFPSILKSASHDFDSNNEMLSISKSIGTLGLALVIPFYTYASVHNICYVFSPETKIINKLLK